MAQANPTYEFATGKSEKPIVDALVRKYGSSNVSWPIVLMENDQTVAYLYEYNEKNKLNRIMDSRPGSRSHVLSYYLMYSKTGRWSVPRNEFLTGFLSEKYSCSYDYILEPASPYSSVDLDYVWYNGRNFKGFELTTFYMDFYSHDRALCLISQMNKRPSWRGGPKAFHKIVESASDLGVDYYLVCANTVSRVGSALKTDGNVCLFQLTHEQVDLIAGGKPPQRTLFLTFSEFLAWL